ncbi:MAG: hypothetical protein AAF902_01230 [Chloroflexota bacterium]
MSNEFLPIDQIKEKLGVAYSFASRATLTGLGVTSFLVAKLGDDYDAAELAIAGFGLSVIGWFGGYVVLRDTDKTRSILVSKGIDFRAWLFSNSDDTYPDWFDQIKKTYKPGRRKYALPVGVDPDTGKIVEIQMKNAEVHQIYQGRSGNGKSFLVRQNIIAAAMSGRYQVTICALSGKDYRSIEPMKNLHLFSFNSRKYGREADERVKAFVDHLLQILKDFNAEIIRRQEMVERYGVTDLNDVRADQRPPALMLILEEFTNALEQASTGRAKKADGAAIRDEILSQVQMIMNYGRSSMCFLLLVAQRPSGVIPPGIVKQAVNIVTRVGGPREASTVTGVAQSGAEHLRVFDEESDELSQALIVSSRQKRIVDVPYTPLDALTALAMTYENEVRFTSDPQWVSFYKRSQNRQITLALSPNVPTHAPVRESKRNKTVTRVTVPAESGSIRAQTVRKVEKIESVTPTQNLKPALPLASWLTYFERTYPQINWPENSPHPSKHQWVALSLFAAAKADYMQISGPAVFNGSHGDHRDSWATVLKYRHSLTAKVDLSQLKRELDQVIAFYYEGYPIVKGFLPENAALTMERFIALGLCIHAGLSKNKTVLGVFGNKKGTYMSYHSHAENMMRLYAASKN